MCKLLDKERIDSLLVNGLKMIQSESGYRFSIDPFLLVDFASVGRGDKVVDLGTASGVIPLLLASTVDVDSVVGVELQKSLSDRARRNVKLNGLSEKVVIRQLDVCAIPGSCDFAAGGTDAVVMNPPYRAPETGRVSGDAERAACRHELHGGVGDFLGSARWLLKQGGRVSIVFLAERLAELIGVMQSHGLEPKRLRMVYSARDREAHLVLIEGRKGGRKGLKVLPPLYIYESGGYSAEIRRIFGGASNLPVGNG